MTEQLTHLPEGEPEIRERRLFYLVSDLQAGKANAMEHIYSSQFPILLRKAMALGLTFHDGEDVVSRTIAIFLNEKVWSGLDKRLGRFGAYLDRILKSEVRSFQSRLRKRTIRDMDFVVQQDIDVSDACDNLMESEETALVLEFLRSNLDELRNLEGARGRGELFDHLVAYLGFGFGSDVRMSESEIARKFGLEPSTIRSRLHRLRKELATRLRNGQSVVLQEVLKRLTKV